MTNKQEEQAKAAPGALAIVQAFVNTQYGHWRYAHSELTNVDQLRTWLVAHELLAAHAPVTEGDVRRVLQMREALRGLLRANSGMEMPTPAVEQLNHLAGSSPLRVRFGDARHAILEPDISGVDGALAQLLGITYTAMIDGTWERLKVCSNEHCQKAFYDISKNRSGTWCSMASCGSRLKARAYRSRKRASLD